MPRLCMKFPAFTKTPLTTRFCSLAAVLGLLAAAAVRPQANATSVIEAAACGGHSLYLTDDGTLWGMGYNIGGQLGDDTTTDRKTPVQVATGVVAMSAGGWHSLFIKNDGTLWGMGLNIAGQLGDGTTTDRKIPVQVATDVVAVSAGWHHSLFVKSDGSLWAMGNNDLGRLGDGTTTNRLTPAQVTTDVVAVSAGWGHSLFVKNDGTLWGMGWNEHGQLGDGWATGNTPTILATDVVAMSAGWGHSLFVKNDGTLWGMGWNEHGQLGDGWATANPANRSTPVQMATDVVAVSAGYGHSLFVKNDGTLWGTGWNEYGQLDDGTTTNRLTPVQMTTDVAAVSAGWGHSLFVKNDGTLWGVGYNELSPLGIGTVTNQATPAHIAGGDPYGPVIVMQPDNQTAAENSSAQFTFAAVGNPVPTLQWQSSANGSTWTDLSNAGPCSGVTTDTLTVTTDSTGLNGMQYRCIATNSEGSDISNAAILTITLLPVIITHPAGRTVQIGSNATFTVVAAGKNLTYQWQKDGAKIPGATSASYTIYSALQSNGGSYKVVVSNAHGIVTSQAATLTVTLNGGSFSSGFSGLNGGGGGTYDNGGNPIGGNGGGGSEAGNDSTGSGGGGGGAPSLLWLGAVGVMLLLRRAAGNHRKIVTGK